MALSQTISALTREKFMPILVDNIFNSNALCLKLLKNADLLDGGVKINVPVEIAQNGNSGFLAPGAGGATAQAITDIAHKATYDWATAYNSVVLSGDEMHINMGANQVVSLLKARMANAEKTIRDLFGTGLFANGQVSNGLVTLNGSGIAVDATVDSGGVVATLQAHDNGNGIIHDLSDDGLTATTATFMPLSTTAESICGYDRTLAGIDSGTPGTNDFWNSNLGTFEYGCGFVSQTAGATVLTGGNNDAGAQSFADFTTTSNGVALGVIAMTRMYGACSVDNDQPDLIVTTQAIFDAYESSLQANKRFDGDSTLADAGFQTLRFKGATVVVDSHCPVGQMYFLNTKYLDFKVHNKRNFAFEDYKPLEAKDAMQARIFWMGQLVCSNPSRQGLLVGGPA